MLNNLASVSQNAQAAVGSRQSRTYIFDMVGRLTTETNPETGTTSYTYDTDSTCSSTSAGDMVRRVAAGSTTSCYYYDSLHRTTAINYPTGCSRFVYDAATVNGIVMQNAKGRLAETSTDACAPPFNVTEEGFSYTSRGEVATVYQSTPHSGGYYTLNSSYWPNGALNTLSGIGLPTITYGPDGEGRPKTVSASSGQNPVTATSYNANSQVTSVTLGSGDAVTNGFDPNTGRQTSYAEAINGSTISGTLTWNPNGTLNHLVVADPFNASDVQTCNYSHDDLTRIASANCGTPWSQTFTYDPFGNLTKNGSITWNPGYNTATNHYTLGGTTYDATGNLLNDTFHTYTWHVDGRPLTVDAISLTHDAQGRIVEKNNGGVFTEYVYSAGGNKIAIMNGQTLVKGLVPLPGRIQATYDPTNSGYRIPDWLGTVRFASNANRTYSSSEAFAPFGERYSTGGSAPSNYTFTGMINSTVSDEYDFLFRSLQTSQGRWISPDPAGLAAVNLVSPQSWNRYAYVLNNPLSLVDPLGLACSTDPCPPGREPGAPEPGGGGGSDGSGGSSDPSPPGFPKPEQPPGREGGGGGGILRQAMQNATVALENKYCAGVVDGGKGFASSTLASNFAAMNGTSDPAETASFGTITSDNLTGSLAFYGKKGVGGTTTTTAPIYGFLPSGTRVFSGWMSTIIMNSNPLGLFMNPSLVSVLATGTGTGYSNQTFQTIELLHELGHGSALFGAPSAVVSDGDDLALSGQNTQAIENGCFPQGDFGGNQGPIASPPTAVPAIARPHRIR